jgi:transposase-like protein
MMEKPNFSDEFKRDAVAQITERGYPVAEISQRLGVSLHAVYPSRAAPRFQHVRISYAQARENLRQSRRSPPCAAAL